MLSKKVKYALKAVLYMARHYDEQRIVIISEISNAEYIPHKFLEKILLQLKLKGILESKVGRQGGYRLSRAPDKITVGEIVRLLEGKVAPIPCVSKFAYERCFDCEDEKTCEIRRVMQHVRDAMVKILDHTSLRDALSSNSKTAISLSHAIAV
ncbi:MAG TPA: Rrf2 family transcriptional regulator [Chitinophagales bacterium]|nr:Rrf2 family transcriptional regulator [Chitinophagales bacterium]